MNPFAAERIGVDFATATRTAAPATARSSRSMRGHRPDIESPKLMTSRISRGNKTNSQRLQSVRKMEPMPPVRMGASSRGGEDFVPTSPSTCDSHQSKTTPGAIPASTDTIGPQMMSSLDILSEKCHATRAYRNAMYLPGPLWCQTKRRPTRASFSAPPRNIPYDCGSAGWCSATESTRGFPVFTASRKRPRMRAPSGMKTPMPKSQ
mmetsp:Transcript_83471/g.232860  ORF Transcript_83471/g.232860 Transcript_83471/m.232860 type:complete len:207 (-) Transcript_83471:1112-1732(-)